MTIPAIKIEQVHKSFGKLNALRGVDLQIEQGEFFALLGPNGAGKSTLINILAGLMRPDSGHLAVLGHDVVSDYRQARRLLGVVPQELVFDPFFNVREMLRFQAGYFGRGPENDPWIDEVLEGLGLTDKAYSNMRSLSGGMKRRALIAQALAHKPPVLVLDEPTAGVDVEVRQMLWAFINRLNKAGTTIILTTHYLEEAETLCSRVAMLKQGEIVALDSTRNLLNRLQTKQLRLKLQGPLPESLLPLKRGEVGGYVMLNLAATTEVEHILAELRAANVGVEDLQLIEADLEDVFLDIMGNKS
ncbi:MAG TPA: ABC transporter ATP-binding protein [Methylophilaceae bacterium]|jgi:ABC-2 type transport system ATP-binding protein